MWCRRWVLRMSCGLCAVWAGCRPPVMSDVSEVPLGSLLGPLVQSVRTSSERCLGDLADRTSTIERSCAGEVLGDRVQLAVGVLADLGQSIERLIRGDLEPL